MPEQLEILRMAQAMARHAAQRQSIVARNIAHADTPGYKAQDVAAFRDIYRSAGAEPLRATRPGHLRAAAGSSPAAVILTAQADAPKGNTVSLETEMVKSVEAQRQHSQALTVYSKSLELLRMSLGRIR